MKNTLILGATTNTNRYAYLAAEMLTNYGHNIFPVGIKTGTVFGKNIEQNKDNIIPEIDTITLYIGEGNQPEWYNYIIETKPKRIIFNPGTKNEELIRIAEEKGIECVEGCTLVMLRSNQF